MATKARTTGRTSAASTKKAGKSADSDEKVLVKKPATKAEAKKAPAKQTARKAPAKAAAEKKTDDVTTPPAKGHKGAGDEIDKSTGGDTSKEAVKPADKSGDGDNPAPEPQPPEVVAAKTDETKPAGVDASGDTEPPAPGTRVRPDSPDTVRNDPVIDELEPTAEFPSGKNPIVDVTPDEVPNGQVAPDYANEADPNDVLARRTKAMKNRDPLPTI